jgi:hypothetical protein
MQPWVDWAEFDAAAEQMDSDILELSGAVQTTLQSCRGAAVRYERTPKDVVGTVEALSGCTAAVRGHAVVQQREVSRIARERFNLWWRYRWLELRRLWRRPLRRS